jgi:putative inorganic carbon (HCO3(-)) transporter
VITVTTWAPIERLRPNASVLTVGALAGISAVLTPLYPWHVLVGAAAVVLVTVCVARPELALLLLVATGPLELALPVNPDAQLSTTKLAGLICFSSFALNAILVRRRLIFDRSHALVFLLLGIALLSTAGAADIAVAKSTSLRYASFVGLFFVLSQLGGSRLIPERIAWVLSLGSAATGALGLSRFFSGETLQVSLPHGDPNDIGFALATTLPLTLWLLGRTTGLRRLFVLGLVGLIALSILLTLSRGALVGLGAAGLWMVLVDRRHIRALLATALAVAVAVGLALHFEGNRIQSGLQAKETVAAENIRSRLAAWHAAANFAATEPLLGVGPGNFATRYREIADEPVGQFVVKVVHNAYLDVAAELGVAAMVIFIGYLVLILSRLVALDRQSRGPPHFASALIFSLIIGAFSAITLSEQYFAPFWLIGGLTAAMWHEHAGGNGPVSGA